jgi:hypothetical protein
LGLRFGEVENKVRDRLELHDTISNLGSNESSSLHVFVQNKTDNRQWESLKPQQNIRTLQLQNILLAVRKALDQQKYNCMQYALTATKQAEYLVCGFVRLAVTVPI